jgi:hypothetical protein
MKKNGQALLEYTVLITCFIAALIAMQIYIKRGFSGRLKDTADSLGDQYDPKDTDSDFTTSLDSNVNTLTKMVPEDYSYQDNQNNTYYLFQKEGKDDIVSRTFVVQETDINETTKQTGSETVNEPAKGQNLWD